MVHRSIPMLEGRRAALLLALALAALAAAMTSGGHANAGGGGHCRNPDVVKEAGGNEVTINAMCFSPMVLRVAQGTNVTFRNDDQVVHDAVGWSAQWQVGQLRQGGGSQAVSFPAAGYFAYACTYHPGMNGIVIVGDEPAATGGKAGGSVAARLASESAPGASTSTLEADPASTAGVAASEDWAGRGLAGALGAIGSPVLLALGLLGFRRLRGGTGTR